MKLPIYVDYVHTYIIGDSYTWNQLEVDEETIKRWKKGIADYHTLQEEIHDECKKQRIKP